MLFHSRLKENILCAVFLFSKIVFFNGTTWLLSYQLHQLLWSLWWKTDLLLGICYAVKRVLNLTAYLQAEDDMLSTFRVQGPQISSERAQTPPSLHAGHSMMVYLEVQGGKCV